MLKQSETELSDRPSIIKTTSPSIKNIIPTTMATITITSTPATGPSNDQLIIVARTIKNLSDRIKTPVDQIELTSIKAVLWSDSSLGCLIHGSVVNDIEIPGYIITLTANGQTFTFHTDSNIQIVMCSDEKPFEIYHPP